MGLSTQVIKTLLGFTFHNAGSSSCCCQSLETRVLPGGNMVNKVDIKGQASQESRETVGNQRDILWGTTSTS